MSALRAFGRDGGGSVRMRPCPPAANFLLAARARGSQGGRDGWAGSGGASFHSRGCEDGEPVWPGRRPRNQAARREVRLQSRFTSVQRARGSGRGGRCSRPGRSCRPVSPVASRSPGLGWVLPQVCPRRLRSHSPPCRGLSLMCRNGCGMCRNGCGMCRSGCGMCRNGCGTCRNGCGRLLVEPSWHSLRFLNGGNKCGSITKKGSYNVRSVSSIGRGV